MLSPQPALTFGQRLRAYRLQAGLTQAALAQRSNISHRTILDIESGKAQPRRFTALSLADALPLSPADRDALLAAVAARPRERQPNERPGRAAPHSSPVVSPSPDSPVSPAPALTDLADVPGAPTLVALPRTPPTNVPWPISRLLGREESLTALRRLITEDRQRLVTLTGVGGSGKTRLAIQVAQELLGSFVGGVWFVDLAPTSDPSLVSRTVAGVLGVQEVQDVPMLETLLGALRRKRLLLLLDNCEHLLDACAALADRLLTACPELSILATSREPLRIDGERRWLVQPLTVPDPAGARTPEELAEVDAVRLFVDRAQAIDPSFVLTDRNGAAVAQVCTRLDGIPLAIELAASLTGVLSVEQLAGRLDDAFRLLAGATRTGPTRQQTMQATLDWSYTLLDDAEQAAFRTLSVFVGGWTLDAVEALCAADPVPLVLLGRLVEKSLVVAGQAPGGRRYRLLEPVRQYARRLLADSGEEGPTRARQAAHYAALAERAGPMLRGPEQIAWLDRLEAERDNLRAALHWLAEAGEASAFCRLAVVLGPYWEARGYLSEGRRWLDAAVTASRDNAVPPPLRLQTLIAAGRVAHWQVDLDGATALFADALAVAREQADRRGEGDVLSWLASVYRQQGAVERALEIGEESLRLGRAVAHPTVIAQALLHIGVALRHAHRSDLALTILEECVREYRQLGDLRFAAIASTMLGWAALEVGEDVRAEQILLESGHELRVVGDQCFIVYMLQGLAYVADARGEPRRALQLFGASEGLQSSLGMRHSPSNHAKHEVFKAGIREQLAAADYDAAYAAGEMLGLDQVLAEFAAAT